MPARSSVANDRISARAVPTFHSSITRPSDWNVPAHNARIPAAWSAVPWPARFPSRGRTLASAASRATSGTLASISGRARRRRRARRPSPPRRPPPTPRPRERSRRAPRGRETGASRRGAKRELPALRSCAASVAAASAPSRPARSAPSRASRRPSIPRSSGIRREGSRSWRVQRVETSPCRTSRVSRSSVPAPLEIHREKWRRGA